MKGFNMSRLGKGLVGTVIAASALVGAGANAVPTFAVGAFNGIYFQNFETLFRSTAACAASPAGACDAAVAGDPAGYQRVNRNVANNVAPNDIFVGILNVQNIDSPVQGNTVWAQAIGSDRFTGYFAQRVVSVGLTNPADPTSGLVTLGAVAADPFAILAAGEMFRLYSGTTFSPSGTIGNSIISATSGSFWASLGLGSEGYAYTETDLTGSIFDSNGQAFLGLDVLVEGPAYSAGQLELMNDFNESRGGGVAAAGAVEICTAADLANPAVSCTNIAGTSEIEANVNYAPGTSGTSNNWQYASNDPFKLYTTAVPEPSALALVGLALVGLGAARRRRAA